MADTAHSNGIPTIPRPGKTDAAHEEHQYLDMIRQILETGEHRPDRTGTGTLSIFCPHTMRFSLSNEAGDNILPLLTTKRTFLRGVLAELLWFISADTSSLTLQRQGVKIWDGNGSREFLDSVGLSHRETGDLGPVYGFQWRHFGAEYKDAKADYTGQGVDQLREVVDKLKNRTYDRRIILSAWNPRDLKLMALPPCHMFAQFYVSYPGASRGVAGLRQQPAASTAVNGEKTQGTLHCTLYQRSADMGLGVPFNIASYALLTHMLAFASGLQPGTLNHVLGDAHVYVDHIDPLLTQLERQPKPFPTLKIKRDDHGSGVIDGWTEDQFEVVGYAPHKAIPMAMSV